MLTFADPALTLIKAPSSVFALIVPPLIITLTEALDWMFNRPYAPQLISEPSALIVNVAPFANSKGLDPCVEASKSFPFKLIVTSFSTVKVSAPA